MRHAIEHGDLGSLDHILTAIRESGAIERTRECALRHARAAREALSSLAPSSYRDALATLAQEVERKKEHVNRLKNNPAEQELEIRKRLKLLRPDEKSYIVGEESR